MSNKKCTDKRFLELYNQGISDKKISIFYGVSQQAISVRRRKLGLVANFTNFQGIKLNKEQTKEDYKKMLKRQGKKVLIKYNKNKKIGVESYYSKHKEQSKKYNKTYYSKHKD